MPVLLLLPHLPTHKDFSFSGLAMWVPAWRHEAPTETPGDQSDTTLAEPSNVFRMVGVCPRQTKVSSAVAVHVQRQVEQGLAIRECLSEGDVAALHVLSTAARSHLRFEIQRLHLARQPIFRPYLHMRRSIVVCLCCCSCDLSFGGLCSWRRPVLLSVCACAPPWRHKALWLERRVNVAGALRSFRLDVHAHAN